MSKTKNRNKKMAANQQIKVLEGKLAVNESMTRTVMSKMISQYAQKGKRDFNGVLGYPEHISFSDYYHYWTRHHIARRIVNAKPDETWGNRPTIQEDEDTEKETAFEQAFAELDKANHVFSELHNIDRLSGVGRYAVLLIGASGGSDLSEPLVDSSLTGIDDILYLKSFSEQNASVKTYDNNTDSPRYGLPETYELNFGGHLTGQSTTKIVHWTRTLHIAEDALENNIYGIPRLEAVYNLLIDLTKVNGGGSEMFWLNGRGGLSISGTGDTPIENIEQVQSDINDYADELKRVLLSDNLTVTPIEMKIYSPKEQVGVIISLVSAATNIPQRILTGSEQAQLASGQDKSNWLDHVQQRRSNYCEPRMLRPLIDRFIALGALPLVAKYDIVWPDLAAASEKDKADIAVKKLDVIAKYLTSGAAQIMPVEQLFEELLNMSYKEKDLDNEQSYDDAQAEADALELERQQAERAKENGT